MVFDNEPFDSEDAQLVELALIEERLGRPPQGKFEIVVRDSGGMPVVIRNEPFLNDGTPMPTLYWLVDPQLNDVVARLESGGAVKRFEAAIPATEVAAAHQRYATERDARIPFGFQGPRPSGGVAGTRVGVKCLHAHYAYFLTGGIDPVGTLVHESVVASQIESQQPERST